MEVIIEQLGTTNNVLERQKFDRQRLELGRAFSNDVILTDEHVDPVHARLEFDDEGRLWLVDLDSVNGIRRPRHKARLERTEVRSGELFLIGRSRIRVFTGSHAVAPAVRIRFSEVFLLWLGKPQVALALILLFGLVLMLQTWLTTVGEFRFSLIIENNLNQVLLFVALAVGVYFLSVLFKRGGNFLAHLSLLILLFLLTSLLGFVFKLAVFNAGDGLYPLLEVLDSTRGYLLLFLYLWSILYLAFHIPLKRRTVISLVVVGLLVGLNNLPKDERLRMLQPQTFPVHAEFLPPALRLRGPEPVSAFEARIDALYGELEQARQKALTERARAMQSAGERGED